MIEAGFGSVCACGRPIRGGTMIGLVDGEWCCEDCVNAMGEGDES